jgi:hypothetical protein
MTEIEQRINDLVSSFVNEITRLARQAAVDTLQRALAGTGGTIVNDIRLAGGRRGRPAKAPAATAAAPSGRRAKGAKRPAGEILETKNRVYAYIKANPGQRIEQINKVLGTRTPDLSLPLKKLLADGALRVEGERRATRYYPGDGKPAAAGKAPRGRRKRKA